MSHRHIAAVILSYNSDKDVQICAELLAKQAGIKLSIILVDNASRPESLAKTKSWLASWRPDSIIGSKEQVLTWVTENDQKAALPGNIYLITHHENRGYSAGNNIGISLADVIGADAVLIVNPDVRIEDSNYIAVLAESLFAKESNCIAASRIIGLDGKDQNPIRESTYWEELLWPLSSITRRLGRCSYVIPLNGSECIEVPKVSGCCMMLKMDFLRTIGYLDENVFLYCEESILSAKAKYLFRKIIYAPHIAAIHAHDPKEKGNSGQRMRIFIKSRKYYIAHYSKQKKFKIFLLNCSYALLGFLHQIRSFVLK